MKTSLLILPLIISYHVIFAQSYLTEQEIIGDNSDKIFYAVTSGDVDGDGDMDILSTVLTEDGLMWYKNDGAGAFKKQKLISNDVDLPEAISTGDLDNDGDLDVLSASYDDDKIAWYENDGLGNFGLQQIITTAAQGAKDVHVEDLDNDGDLDVISASANDGTISWFENNGSGSFGVEQIITTADFQARAVSASDMDGDGDLDVVSAAQSSGGKIAWYENNGSGVFGTEHNVTSNAQTIESMHLADMDNDGDIDVLFASTNTNTVAWLENDGTGVFGPIQIISDQVNYAWEVYTSDIDDDGDQDVFAISKTAGSYVALYKNDGTGSFGPQIVIDSPGFLLTTARTSDFNGDGKLDLFCGILGPNIFWYENAGGGNFGNREVVNKNVIEVTDVLASDLDNDGDLDIVVSENSGNGGITWLENDGLGTFNEQYLVSEEGLTTYSIFASDLDDDGNTDILSSTIYVGLSSYYEIAWHKNLGNGSFSPSQSISISGSYRSDKLIAEDLDNDGKIDIICAFEKSLVGRVSWFKNNGNGNFGAEEIIASNFNGYNFVDVGDFNDDGLIDIVSSSERGDTIAWYENLGNGNFSTEKVISNLVSGPIALVVRDIDNDGDADIVSASEWDDKIAWYENNGSGVFASQQLIANNVNRPSAIYADDLDNDGDEDVLATSYEDDKVVWYVNDGSGNFSTEQILSDSLVEPICLLTANLDNDEDEDVIFASDIENRIVWHQSLVDTPTLSGLIFYDENNDGIKNGLERTISLIQAEVTPSTLGSFVSTNGVYTYYLDSGLFSLSYDSITAQNWLLSSDSSSYTLLVDSSTSRTDLNFGFIPKDTINSLQLSISSGVTRCDQLSDFYLDARNLGTSIISTTIWLEIDAFISDTFFSVPPDTVNGFLFGWNVNDLYPGESYHNNFQLLLPGVGSGFNLGDSLHFESYAFIESANSIDTFSFEYKPLLLCSYDPNDKLVHPYRTKPENYTLFDETLTYTIRFQNTGNDVAFDIAIIDTLDNNLDWNTFHIISSSHMGKLKTTITDDQFIEFYFENILLPDSGTNFLESQGYVTYSIKSLPGLNENTTIENTAHIFFDNNPAIVTNTTLNTLVSSFPFEVGISALNQKTNWLIYPNPTSDFLYIKLFDFKETYNIEIQNILGQVLLTRAGNNKNAVNVKNYDNGVYYIVLTASNGDIIGSKKFVVNN